MTQVTITHVAPKTLEQKREYYKNQIREVDARKAALKADIHAVSTNSTARSQIEDMDAYLVSAKERLVAFQTQRDTLQRSLTRVNGMIKNRNREKSGRKTI